MVDALPFIYHPDYVTPLPPDHRFPMPKFGAIYTTLRREGLAGPDQFHLPDIATRAQLELVHAPDYVASYLTGSIDPRLMRRIGFPWSPGLVQRTCTAVGGTIRTALLALEQGIACNTAGGTHHAHRDFGSGFCIFNDIAVATRVAQQQPGVDRVLIIDLDVHQGDGTAAIFAGDDSVFTLSVHCDKNFPFRKQQSDLDVALPVGTGDEEYLQRLRQILPDVIAATRPDLVIYDAGVDPHIADRLGKLSLTDAGIYARDHFVLATCRAAAVPVACVVGGGYDKDVAKLALRHCLVYRAAAGVWGYA